MVDGLLKGLGVSEAAFTNGGYPVHTPIDGSQVASVTLEDKAAVAGKIDLAHQAFLSWRDVPAPPARHYPGTGRRRSLGSIPNRVPPH